MPELPISNEEQDFHPLADTEEIQKGTIQLLMEILRAISSK